MGYSDPVQVRVEDSIPPLVTVFGEINYRSAPHLKKTLSELLDAGRSEICLDCGTVDFVDSSGIGVIVGTAERLREIGGQLHLLKRTRQLEHALVVSGFASLVGMGATLLSDTVEAPTRGSAAWQSMSLSLPSGADVDGTVRRRVMELVRTMPFAQDELDDIKLAVGEAASNAFRHGIFRDTSDRVHVTCVGDANGVVVEVRNPGEPFDPDALAAPDVNLLPEGGMGVFFMRASMDTVAFQFGDGIIALRMTKSFRRT